MRVTYMISLNYSLPVKSSDLLHAYTFGRNSRNAAQTLTFPPYPSRKFRLAGRLLRRARRVHIRGPLRGSCIAGRTIYPETWRRLPLPRVPAAAASDFLGSLRNLRAARRARSPDRHPARSGRCVRGAAGRSLALDAFSDIAGDGDRAFRLAVSEDERERHLDIKLPPALVRRARQASGARRA